MAGFLEKIFSGVSKYYEGLMKSKKEQISFTLADINFLSQQLKELKMPASYILKSASNDFDIDLLKGQVDNIDLQTFEISFVGAFYFNEKPFALFCNEDKAMKNDKFHALVALNTDAAHSLEKVSLSEIINKHSLPIWEELVYRNRELNNLVKSKAPNNPWSLYRAAKGELVPPIEYKLQIGGYPQWLINDIDFRKIKKLEFLCEFKLNENCSIYYFNDPDLKEIVFFKQKL